MSILNALRNAEICAQEILAVIFVKNNLIVVVNVWECAVKFALNYVEFQIIQTINRKYLKYFLVMKMRNLRDSIN